VRFLLQIVVMVIIIAALLWYVGIGSLLATLSTIKLEYLLVAFLAYFGINLLFAVRLMRVLGREGAKTAFARTLLAQYAGMLTSDVTPGRSGYFLTPVYLMDQNVPTSVSLSGILGIQTIEFLFKVFGGILALIFLVETASLSGALFVVGVLGVVLMLAGAIFLAALSWSQRVISLFNRIARSRFLARFTGGLMGKLEEYKQSAVRTRKAIPEIAVITMSCWILKGFEWYFLGLALGITQIGWLGFFLLHPLVTALGFVPLTPSGIGFQEGAIVGVFVLLGMSMPQALAFALLSRVLVIVEDLVGVPQVAKSTSSLVFFRKTSVDESHKIA
jgi:glycosyltransferase 2 family protein